MTFPKRYFASKSIHENRRYLQLNVTEPYQTYIVTVQMLFGFWIVKVKNEDFNFKNLNSNLSYNFSY